MFKELQYGRWKYVSFIILDLACLFIANTAAIGVYINRFVPNYGYAEYRPVIFVMLTIDLFVTVAFQTLRHVLRRRKRRELLESTKHVALSFITLSVILFTLRRGAAYSRITVGLAYLFYWVLLLATHIVWRKLICGRNKRPARLTAILMTTDGFVEEGLEELNKLKIDVEDIYLLKNINISSIGEIPVVKTWEDAASVICWKMLDRIYIYGLDHQMIPEYLVKACEDMGLKFHLVDFNYRVIDIKTVKHEDSKYGALSFLEGKRDIPFPIRRAYWITETEAHLHRGFHAHKLNCQLLYCPYGKVDIILDDGQKRTTVTLDKPEKGLILMPGLWREMVWQQSGSVLCVLASEYYDAQEYIRDYDEFIAYNKKYRESADPLKNIKEKDDEGAVCNVSSVGA